MSAGGVEKSALSRQTWSKHFFLVLWYWRSCKEVCGTILWVGEENDSTTLQSICSMHRWPPIQGRRIEIRGRIVTSMLSNCSEMLILGTNWTTWYSMVSEQTSTIDYTMDQGLWQTIISFDLLHSSYIWIHTVLSCGKHCQIMQIGLFQDSDFAGDLEDAKSKSGVPISWMCKKQTSVSHSSTESEIISLRTCK